MWLVFTGAKAQHQNGSWVYPVDWYVNVEEDSLEIGNADNLFTTTLLKNWSGSDKTLAYEAHVFEDEEKEVQDSGKGADNPGILTLYPNPFSTHIIVGGVKEGDRARLYDAVGNQVRSWVLKSERNELNTESIDPGIYLLQIDTGSGMIVKRMVKG
jgi:hypothetical protein